MIIRDYLDGWTETPQYTIEDEQGETFVSVVIAAYNEEKNIADCLRSILANVYDSSKLEIIVIDNGSIDDTSVIISRPEFQRVKLLQQPEGHKKEALEMGFTAAKGALILCTDADSIVDKFWIQSMVLHHEIHGAEFILGPVAIGDYNNLPTRFQAFDMLAMMGVTAGGVRNKSTYLANGANMAFAQSFYNKLGEIPRKDIASGDDVFLLHAFVKEHPNKIYFNRSKAGIVKTKAVKTWKELIQQRIRWASKTTSYVQNKDRNIAAFIFIFCLSIFINIILAPLTGGLSLFFALFQLFIKAVLDYFFIERVNEFFRLKHLMKYYIPSFVIHYLYILFAGVAGILGLSYKWKGKKI